MNFTDIALAAAVHDPAGKLVAAIEELAAPLTGTFSGIALNISDVTAPDVVTALRRIGADIVIHPVGEETIGRIRRDAVRLAHQSQPVLYSDFDHMLRWLQHGRDNLCDILGSQADVDFLVVGRSPGSLSNEPRRLQETERLVNHVYSLLTGENWDLMFAVRRMSLRAAEMIVSQSTIDTLANDVEWPLLARQVGLSVGYAESDALFYRTIEEFGAPADTLDDDPLQWIRRIEFAALQATAMRRFLE